jgi:phosphoadenosine phosphosulfate reductase
VSNAVDLLEQQVAELQAGAERWNAQQLLRWGLSQFGQSLALASSFGAEDVVLIDIASRLSKFRVFTLDTDFLFP